MHLAGLRSPAKVTLFLDGKKAAESEGELQWTSYGISGIVVFQVSRFAHLGIFKKEKRADFSQSASTGEQTASS